MILNYTNLFSENNEEEEVEKPAPDFSKISNPQVRAYMEDKYKKEQALTEAKGKQDWSTYGSIAGKFMEGMSTPTNIRYENRTADVGKEPKRSVGEGFKYDGSLGDKVIGQGIKNAESDLQKTKSDFNDSVQMENYSRGEADYAEDSDPNSEVSKQYQMLAKEFMPGKDFSQVSAKKLKEIMPPLEKLYQHRNKPKAASGSVSRGISKADKKESDYVASSHINELEISPGSRPVPKDTETVRKAKGAYDMLQNSLNELEALYKKSGTNLVGGDSNRQAALETQILMAQKELDALGVLQGRDESLIRQQIPDATSFSENAKGMFGWDSFNDKLAQYRKNLDNQYESTVNARGYKKGNASPKSGGSNGNTPNPSHGKDLP